MMMEDVWPWIGTVVAGAALIAAAAIAWLALLRWLIVIVPAVVLVGFAFEPELQLTAALLGVLALLYLPPLLMAWVWRQAARSRAVTTAGITPPSARELAHQACADEEARDRADRHSKAVSTTRDQDDRHSRARDLEQQGMVSLWSRQ